MRPERTTKRGLESRNYIYLAYYFVCATSFGMKRKKLNKPVNIDKHVQAILKDYFKGEARNKGCWKLKLSEDAEFSGVKGATNYFYEHSALKKAFNIYVTPDKDDADFKLKVGCNHTSKTEGNETELYLLYYEIPI